MNTKFICLLTGIVVTNVTLLIAQEGATKAAEGTLSLNKKNYQLSQAVALEATIDGEDAIMVVLGTQPITSEQLKSAVAAENKGETGDFKRPFLKLVFKKTGELKHWGAADNNTSIGRASSEVAKGEIKVQDGRAIGKASQPIDPENNFPRSFDVKFNAVFLKAGESLPASTAKKGGPAANVKPTVTGSFKGNGKEAKLAYASARWSEPFSGKPGITLVFTEKDHSKDKKPDTSAMFGKFGSALIISLHEDGSIYGCQVVHSALKHSGFSSIGSIDATSFTYEDGKVEGELTTNGEVDTFGDKWDVNLKFVAPLGEIPKEYQVAESTSAAKTAKPTDNESDADEDEESATSKPGSQASATGVSGPKAKELSLTKDATDVEYKALVEQIAFKSKSPVKSVCAELASSLKAQGWTNEGPDLVNPNSSILKRKHGNATLTIFVKPENGGSEVKMMTEGLSWDGE